MHELAMGLMQLSDLFCEAKRLLSPDGVMVHLIDLNDHINHDNVTLSRINFL